MTPDETQKAHARRLAPKLDAHLLVARNIIDDLNAEGSYQEARLLGELLNDIDRITCGLPTHHHPSKVIRLVS